jgi:hypothetical protein
MARLPLIVNSIDPFSRLMHNHGIAREISLERILEANRVEGIRRDLSRDIQMLREEGNWELLTEYLEWKNATLQLSNWLQRKID